MGCPSSEAKVTWGETHPVGGEQEKNYPSLKYEKATEEKGNDPDKRRKEGTYSWESKRTKYGATPPMR